MVSRNLFYANFTNTNFKKVPIPHLRVCCVHRLHTMKIGLGKQYGVRLILIWLTRNSLIPNFLPESKVALTKEFVHIKRQFTRQICRLAKNGDVICGLPYTKLSSVQMQNYASMLGMFQIRISNLTVTGKITKNFHKKRWKKVGSKICTAIGNKTVAYLV